MGVLQIETRKERLRNLGAVRSPTVDTGAAQAAQIIGNANNQLFESRKRLAAGASSLGDALLKSAISMTEFDRKIRTDDFMMKYQAEMNAFMNGDGTAENRGAINEDFQNAAEWKGRIDKRRGEAEARLRKECGITDYDWDTRVKSLTSGFDEQWKARMATHAFQVNEKRSQVSSTGRRDQIEQTLAFGDGTHDMYMDWVRAMNNEAVAHHAGMTRDQETGENVITDQGVYDQFMRKGALRLVAQQYKNDIKLATSETDGLESRKDVEAIFDAKVKKLKREDGTYDFSQIVKDPLVESALGETKLMGMEKAFEADWKSARKQAANAADTLFRQHKYQAEQDAQEAEIKQMQVWEQSEVPITNETKAQFYSELARRNKCEVKDGKDIREADGVQYPLEKYNKTSHILLLKKAEYWRNRDKVDATKAVGAAQKISDADWDAAALKYLVMPNDFADAEAKETWLEDRRHFEIEFYKAFERREISRETAARVQGLLDKHFDQETETAITKLLDRFGVTVGTGKMFPTVDAAKSDLYKGADTDTLYDIPLAVVGVKKGMLWDTEKRMTTKPLGQYVIKFADLLSKRPKGMDVEAFTTECEDEIVRLYLENANTTEVLDTLQINFGNAAATEKRKQADAKRDVNWLNTVKGN